MQTNPNPTPPKKTAVPIEVLMPLMLEHLASGQSVAFSPQGESMLPMLRSGKDSVILSPAPERLKKYDVALYQRENGRYILHRVVKVEGDAYVMIGDHQLRFEGSVSHSQILAVVTAFYRNGKYHTVTEPGYRLYCSLMNHCRRAYLFVARPYYRLRRKLRQARQGDQS